MTDWVGYVVKHDDSLPATQTDGGRKEGAILPFCFQATSLQYAQLFRETYRILDCEYRGHDRPQWWRYEGSVEQQLTRMRPSAVMIGSDRPPRRDCDATVLDVTDPRNDQLRQMVEGFRQRFGQIPKPQPKTSACRCIVS